MPKKIASLSIRVESARSSQFPIDMLRYDSAYPRSERDSGIITNSLSYEKPPTEDRRVVEVTVTANGAPNVARWQSFSWQVTHVWDDRTGGWVRYNNERVYK